MTWNVIRYPKRWLLAVWVMMSQWAGAASPAVSTFEVNNGLARTLNPVVTLVNACPGATGGTHSYMASEAPDFSGAEWRPYAAVPAFVLSGGSGTKRVYFKVKDGVGAESSVTSDTIELLATGASIVAWGYNSYGQNTIPLPNLDFIATSGGRQHTLGLKANGSVLGWGRDNNKQCTVPEPNQDFVAVSAGYAFSLGLKADGTVVAWGDNSKGQCNVPEPNGDFVIVSAGYQHALGLKTNGSIVAWGDNSRNQCQVPEPNTGYGSLAGGYWHSLGLKADGSIVAWGNNTFEQCDVPLPNSGFLSVSAAGHHNVALKADGRVVAWGPNDSGECTIPPPNTDYVEACAGYWHSLGLKADGSIVAWGNDKYDQTLTPFPNRGFASVAAGENHSLALAFEGDLQVFLAPAGAIEAGARWRLAGNPTEVWRNSGDLTALPLGEHSVELFDDLAGWYAQPTSQTVSILGHVLTSVTCLYVPGPTYSLAVTAEHGSVTRSPSKLNYRPGSAVTLTATPDPHWHFTGWSGDLTSTDNPTILTLDASKTVTAHFEPDTYVLTVETAGSTGTVSVSPEWPTYPHGSEVTLTALPVPGHRFVRWEGDVPPGSEDANPLIVTMTTHRMFRAVFAPLPHVPQWLMSRQEEDVFFHHDPAGFYCDVVWGGL